MGLFWASKDAAAATAAYRVLVSIVPAQQAQLEQLYNASLAAVPDTSAEVDRGSAIGERAAAAMIAARTNDGRFGAPRLPDGARCRGSGVRCCPAFVNDPAGWLRFVKPFLLESQSQFRSAGPFALTSAAYATEFNQVKSIGSLTSATRTMFQTNSVPLLGGERCRGRGTASSAPCPRRRGSRSRRTHASSPCTT